MNIAFYNAQTALQSHQKNIDNIANNMANVSTNGYKAANSDFDDLVYQQINSNDKTTNILQGHGVKLAGTKTNFTQGALQRTDNLLDFAIMGEGFFAINDGNAITYTRDGSFYVGRSGEENYLVRADGSFVLDSNLQPIRLATLEDGTIDAASALEQLGVFVFENLDGLEKANATGFYATTASGLPTVLGADSKTNLVQGALEMSNLDMGTGMVQLMEGQRAFQLNARVIQTADQIEEIVNNLR
ncbi:MAG: flagellar hook-basal body protein [Erysipelotrichaceae bacterium]